VVREFGSSQKMPVVPPSSKRDRSGSNLSNTDANAAALIAAHLSVTEAGASTPGGSASAGAHFSAGSHAGAQSSSSSIPFGEVLFAMVSTRVLSSVHGRSAVAHVRWRFSRSA
jgi:hypothetical protein